MDLGVIEITYNGGVSQNLYSAGVQIENNSSKSLKNFVFDISVDWGFVIYRDKALIIQRELTKSLFHTDDYSERREYVLENMNEEVKPLDYQNELTYVARHRQYSVPVLNPKSKIYVELLIDGPQNLQGINAGIFEENVDLVFKADEETTKRNRQAIINILASVIYIIGAFPIIIYSPSISYAVWAMVASSLICFLLAWAVYFLFMFVKSFFKR